jgi:hypothetical protein
MNICEETQIAHVPVTAIAGYVAACWLSCAYASGRWKMAGIVVTVPIFLYGVLHLFNVFLLQLWTEKYSVVIHLHL